MRTSNMNRSVSRRVILRGAGVALVLPWMESLQPKAALAQAQVRKRYLPIFLPNGAALPADTVVNKQAQLHYHLDDFRNAIDLLRYEKPIYMFYNGSGGGFENGIRTMSEKVGEGEGSP